MPADPFPPDLAARYDAWYKTPWGRAADVLERELLESALNIQPGESVLDVGCGTARWLSELQTPNSKLQTPNGLRLGVEPSAEMLKAARPRAQAGIRLVRGAGEALPFADRSFDVVTLVTSLEFVPDPARAVREALRVARRRVAVAVLNRWSIVTTARRIKGLFVPTVYRGARFFSPPELARLIEREAGRKPVWRTTLLCPLHVLPLTRSCERSPLLHKLPFGAFLVMRIDKI
ncbi:MAG: methyltransferase domain-containing protein [Nitrospirae bacterium]|nr:methyltransferase domain-containing protein [Nitrospirota bacterium]